MNARRRLPHRRGAVALDIEHAGHRFRMQIGCFPDGTLAEIFLDAAKQNSALDAFAADAAILVSLLLQHGATLGEIGHVRRAPDGTAASLVGAVVDRLAEMGFHQHHKRPDVSNQIATAFHRLRRDVAARTRRSSSSAKPEVNSHASRTHKQAD
jgi:hypothetical protein